jgi:uroporphyrinogen decarboxylase
MRMAGRSLPEYKRVREGIAMLESCTRPELVTEITLQPLRRYAVDAAVLFSDIVVPLRAVGVDVDIKPGVGPVVERPYRAIEDIERLRPLTPDDVPYISEAVKSLVGELGGTPLIGFAGGPFTLASYLIEGGPSKNHDRTKAMMYGAPELWHALMGRLADIAIAFLSVQVEAGASAVQLFDSWVGVVSPEDYRHAILPHTSRIFAALATAGVPRIHFGVGTGELLGLLGEAGADVVGVDWRIPLEEAARRVSAGAGVQAGTAQPGTAQPGTARPGTAQPGTAQPGTARRKAVQGNLDPAILLAGWDVVEPRARAILDGARSLNGHVFNLGHGVLPETSPDILARLTDFVHEYSAR